MFGMVPDLLYECDPCLTGGPENAEPGYLGHFCSRTTCLGIILTTSWLRLCLEKGSKRQRRPGPSWSLSGSARQAAGCFCLEVHTLKGSISALLSPQTCFTQQQTTACSPFLDVLLVWEEPGPSCVFDLTDPKGQVNKCN